jgi:phosphoenolpyruvate phosphomutase
MLEEAGVSGVCIEDKVYPKANSFSTRGQHLVSIDEFNLKIKAARKARSCNDFWIVARTEAFVAGHDADEALRRAENYADAGADAIVVQTARTDVSEVRAFGQSWSRNLPLIVIPTKYPNATIATLSALNVKGIIYANQGLRAAVAAMKNAYAKILEEGHAGSLESSIVEIEEIFSIQGEDFLRELEMTLGVK